MTATEFEARIVDWARQQKDIAALVLAGSRVRSSGGFDVWSDWDFHLITSRPQRYHQADWLHQIAPCWCAHSELTPRGVIKVSGVFDQGFEADFVPLASWQMKSVYAAMPHADWKHMMPYRLRRGIQETRSFMLGSGYRILIGSSDWQHRLNALECEWPEAELEQKEFKQHVTSFWQKSVWIFKKIVRPELRSAMHWLHLLMVRDVYALLQEEARLAGRRPRPEARKAEQWLDETRLRQTEISTGPDQLALANALLAEMTLFSEVTASVAASRGFPVPDYSAVNAWLRDELAKVIANARRS
ncbi:MAG: aminoglycoside 6-adenylyltransferase [Opitutae bacterium]